MSETIESGDLSIRPWPDPDGDLEIEFDNVDGTYATGWLNRPDVLTLVKELIKNFEFKGDVLNDQAE